MELVLVRHAQPAWANPDGTSTNSPGLTPLGRMQAERLAEWLAGEESPDFDALIGQEPVEALRDPSVEVDEALTTR